MVFVLDTEWISFGIPQVISGFSLCQPRCIIVTKIQHVSAHPVTLLLDLHKVAVLRHMDTFGFLLGPFVPPAHNVYPARGPLLVNQTFSSQEIRSNDEYGMHAFGMCRIADTYARSS